jgi:hypothetical protein
MARNTELLERVMQHITDHPEQHNQHIWANECGTSGCFAGWSALLSGWNVLRRGFALDVFVAREDDPREVHVQQLAIELLGLTSDEADVLFDEFNTPDMLQRMVKDLVNGDRLGDCREYRDEEEE